jgi:hypothetical protein
VPAGTLWLMRFPPGILARFALGDAALIAGILGLAGMLPLGRAVSLLLLVLGLALNALVILQIVKAARE